MDQVFTVSAIADTEFRPKKVSPVELLAIAPLVTSEKFHQSIELYEFVLTHLEVHFGETWMPVKVADREIYMPDGIENNIIALSQLANWFLTNVVFAAFQSTSE